MSKIRFVFNNLENFNAFYRLKISKLLNNYITFIYFCQ